MPFNYKPPTWQLPSENATHDSRVFWEMYSSSGVLRNRLPMVVMCRDELAAWEKNSLLLNLADPGTRIYGQWGVVRHHVTMVLVSSWSSLHGALHWWWERPCPSAVATVPTSTHRRKDHAVEKGSGPLTVVRLRIAHRVISVHHCDIPVDGADNTGIKLKPIPHGISLILVDN
eukprot:scpid92451/ scgid30433/ 